MRTPLYHHTSPETALLVEDYPYGFRLRCKIRYWLEWSDKHGHRLVSQTSNPKKGDAWNKPKASTYASLGACMYRDDDGHVHHAAFDLHDPARAKAFVEDFPGAVTDLIRGAVIFKVRELEKGPRQWTIGGVAQPITDRDRETNARDLAAWRAVQAVLDGQRAHLEASDA